MEGMEEQKTEEEQGLFLMFCLCFSFVLLLADETVNSEDAAGDERSRVGKKEGDHVGLVHGVSEITGGAERLEVAGILLPEIAGGSHVLTLPGLPSAAVKKLCLLPDERSVGETRGNGVHTDERCATSVLSADAAGKTNNTKL